MGWAGGTSLFDPMVNLALSLVNESKGSVSREETQEIVGRVYELFKWSDWDTEDESEYFVPYLIEIMREQGRIDDEYYQSVVGDEFDM